MCKEYLYNRRCYS